MSADDVCADCPERAFWLMTKWRRRREEPQVTMLCGRHVAPRLAQGFWSDVRRLEVTELDEGA